mmetsp:Transcript_42294/g.136354  ORF Transcript_42294/g.136354 Transcript_42294/m.136354 type:complete len:263 (+) Transcript_42294:498-1286(+)
MAAMCLSSTFSSPPAAVSRRTLLSAPPTATAPPSGATATQAGSKLRGMEEGAVPSLSRVTRSSVLAVVTTAASFPPTPIDTGHASSWTFAAPCCGCGERVEAMRQLSRPHERIVPSSNRPRESTRFVWPSPAKEEARPVLKSQVRTTPQSLLPDPSPQVANEPEISRSLAHSSAETDWLCPTCVAVTAPLSGSMMERSLPREYETIPAVAHTHPTCMSPASGFAPAQRLTSFIVARPSSRILTLLSPEAVAMHLPSGDHSAA